MSGSRIVLVSGCLISAGLSGCADTGRLFQMHTSANRRADAERSWRAVRAKVKLQLAQNLLDSGNTKEARAALQEVADSNDPAVLLMLAKIELAEGHLSGARQAATSALAIPDAGAEAYYVAGLVEERYENYVEAAKDFESARLMAPSDADYLLAQAEALVKLSRPVEAIKLVEAHTPDFPDEVSLRLFVAETNEMLDRKSVV